MWDEISVNKNLAVFIYITKNNPKIIKKTLSKYTSIKLEKYFFSVQQKEKNSSKKFSIRNARLVDQKL